MEQNAVINMITTVVTTWLFATNAMNADNLLRLLLC